MVAEGDDGLHSGLDRSSTGTSPRRGLTTEFSEVHAIRIEDGGELTR